jgi:hypothetical protein
MVELSSCKDDEERVGWLDIESIAMTARNDECRRARSRLLSTPEWPPAPSPTSFNETVSMNRNAVP